MTFMQTYVTKLPGYEDKHVSEEEVKCVARPSQDERERPLSSLLRQVRDGDRRQPGRR